MSKIIAIDTAVPAYKHRQQDILGFMQKVYAGSPEDNRKIQFLYHQSGVNSRYSVLGDYSRSMAEWKFYPRSENLEPFPSLEQRMAAYNKHAAPLSVDAIRKCIDGKINVREITHLVTVSCTGMSAPGLDLQIMDMMDMCKNIYRTSINFMGCYAAIHALKIADAICRTEENARVVIVCTELCTLHFQRELTVDNITSSMLFADGSAAALLTGDHYPGTGLQLNRFYSEILPRGKKDMAWELSSSGFLMTLSGYIPELIKEDFERLVEKAIESSPMRKDDIAYWCIHPGGKRILDAIQKSMKLGEQDLATSCAILEEYGNMSSPTILFVLKRLLQQAQPGKPLLGAAFGPGLTMETFLAELV
ncbi:MAG: type III polyketide synthase [Chitinophagaceae bacterium]|nr:type III polyketide synthase [Chitinophagaceae bacterium]MCW5929280.1 type III polyketide synthase [Chitinophagaceae bacterium]